MALSALPAAGQTLTASLLSTWLTERTRLGAVKTVDQSLTNSSTLVNDNELFVSLAANATYVGKLALFYNSGTTPDLKVSMTLPAGAAGNWGGVVYSLSSVLLTFGVNSVLTGTAIGGLGSEVEAVFDMELTTAAAAGVAQVQWAQNTATASATVVNATSFLSLSRVA